MGLKLTPIKIGIQMGFNGFDRGYFLSIVLHFGQVKFSNYVIFILIHITLTGTLV
jgi:hypothetical protein